VKIRMTVTIEVNEEKWATEYGLRPEAVREDAREFLPELIRTNIEALPHFCDGLASVTRFE
jgi:hypothetical protein